MTAVSIILAVEDGFTNGSAEGNGLAVVAFIFIVLAVVSSGNKKS